MTDKKGVTRLADVNPVSAAVIETVKETVKAPRDNHEEPYHIATTKNIWDPNYEDAVAEQGFDIRNPQPPRGPTRDKADPIPKNERHGELVITVRFRDQTGRFRVILPNLAGNVPATQRTPVKIFKMIFAGIKRAFPNARVK